MHYMYDLCSDEASWSIDSFIKRQMGWKTEEFVYVYVLCMYVCVCMYAYIQGVPGGKDLTSGECSLGQTIPI